MLINHEYAVCALGFFLCIGENFHHFSKKASGWDIETISVFIALKVFLSIKLEKMMSIFGQFAHTEAQNKHE